MDMALRAFFAEYQRLFNQALDGAADLDAVASVFAPAFVAASPHGVTAGRNDEALKDVMEQGYDHYRAIGTKAMRIRDLKVMPLDALHSVATVAWTAVYRQGTDPDVEIDFDVHYLIQKLNGTPKIFGWVTGDERAVLRQHGIG